MGQIITCLDPYRNDPTDSEKLMVQEKEENQWTDKQEGSNAQRG